LSITDGGETISNLGDVASVGKVEQTNFSILFILSQNSSEVGKTSGSRIEDDGIL